MIAFRRKRYDLIYMLLPLVFLVILFGALGFDRNIAILVAVTTIMSLCGIVYRNHRVYSRVLFILYFPFYLCYSFSIAFVAPICHDTLCGFLIPILGSWFHYILLSNLYHYIKKKHFYIRLIPVVVVFAIYLPVMFVLSAQVMSVIPALIMLSISLIAIVVFMRVKSLTTLWRYSCYFTFLNSCFAVVLSYFIVILPNHNIGFVLCSYLMSYSILSARIIKEIANERNVLILKSATSFVSGYFKRL